MCGIAGYVDTDGSPPDEALASAMASLLAPRRPDGARAGPLANGSEGPTVVPAAADPPHPGLVITRRSLP